MIRIVVKRDNTAEVIRQHEISDDEEISVAVLLVTVFIDKDGRVNEPLTRIGAGPVPKWHRATIARIVQPFITEGRVR